MAVKESQLICVIKYVKQPLTGFNSLNSLDSRQRMRKAFKVITVFFFIHPFSVLKTKLQDLAREA